MHIRQMILTFLLCLVVFPATASAQSIHVLGIDSIEGDDELARNLSSALRASLSEQGCHVDPRDISLMQMSLVFGDTGLCSQIDVGCLDGIAQHLSTGSLVFGIMHRVFTDVGQEVEVELHYYDRLERRIISHYTTRLSLTASREALEAIADAAAPELIRCVRSASAEVAVDEDEVGSLPVATHGLSETSEEDLLIPPDQLVDAGFESASRTSNEWIGWSLIGLGGALLLSEIPIMVRINDLNNDPGYRAYRYSLLPTGTACTPDAPGNVSSICSEGSTLEILEFVFLGLGLASAGTGALLLATGVLVTPSVSADHATLSVTGSF
jgi:hypothetical protein